MRILTVGRNPQNNVVLSDPMVSVRHLELRQYDNGQYSAIDLNSTNGTYVNGQRIQGEVLLRRGDKVRIGQTNLPWLQYFGEDDSSMSAWMIVLIVLGGIVSLVMVSLFAVVLLKSAHKNHQLGGGDKEIEYVEVPQPTDIVVAPGQTFENAYAAYYPSQSQDRERNIGGAKFLAEQAADKQEQTDSRNYQGNSIRIRVCPLHEMYVVPDCHSKSPVALARSGAIEIASVNVHGMHSATMTVRNLTQSRVEVMIYQGMMLEIINEGQQNLVISKDVQIVLEASETRSVRLETYCASPHRDTPSGPARVTPYRMNAPTSIYQSQTSVWQYVESKVSHRVVFYVGANGTCVHVPSLGYASYSAQRVSGSHITYQSQMNFSATDSCVVYLNDYQYGCVKREVESVRESSSSIFSRTDATSFVMDVAEAGGIYYGARSSISSSQQFISTMRTYSAHR